MSSYPERIWLEGPKVSLEPRNSRGEEEYVRADLASRHLPVGEGAIADIAAERQRQIEQEGWTPEHDDSHNTGEMAHAAACYAIGKPDFGGKILWPWDSLWWKPAGRRRNLVKAGALIAAEIDRRDRLNEEEGR